MKVFKFWPPYQANGHTTFPETTNRSGVYLIREGEKLVYIGYSATNLYRTMYRHFQRWNHRGQEVVSYAGSSKRYTVRVVLCTPAQAARLEKALIIKNRPRDNRDKYRGYKLDFQDKKTVDQYENQYAITDAPF